MRVARFADCGDDVSVLDVPPHESPEATLAAAQTLLAHSGAARTLVLADVFGATPSNVAHRLVEGTPARLLVGVNLPMLLRAICYRHEPLEQQTARALAGGSKACCKSVVVGHLKTRIPGKNMVKTEITISNKLGLHARASAKLTKLAGSFRAMCS